MVAAHMGEYTGHAVAMPGMPEWLRLGGAVVLAAVAAVHGVHGAGMHGQRRWWHLGHAVMAAGMAAMYLLPRMDYEPLYGGGLALFAALALATVGAALGLRSREGALNPIWTMSALDYLAMTYMLVDPAVRPAWPGLLLALYLAVAAFGWTVRAFDRLPAFARPAVAGAEPPLPAAPSGTDGGAGPALLSAAPQTDPAQRPRTRVSVALTLALMAAAMAYMLVAM
ncbi:DUF5134 domain-containing protein [Streptomonospora litoralis]|uniref:DUF5134 domain-containing protein n=1 Tax=Streptomonospora litoralis TaxID=2498135 RepID=A0A4P6Q7V9_9ACTN|nr:DUF5134 domain-containing protein [Streptomonospora litoralis]QBI54947.1 hypothetical protein EKD16_15875 [Streptomonospora litoralis]